MGVVINEERYIRRDDPAELVKITGRDRTPNGFTHFEFIKPEHHKGKKSGLTHTQFEVAYKREHESPAPPVRKPTSTGSRDEWRAWALKLEKDYDDMERSYERVCAMDKTGNTW